MIKDILFAAVGFVIGAFTPAVGREIKVFFVKETTAAKAAVPATVTADAKSVVATVVADVKADVTAVEKKL
jgi:hypothetical protein